MIKFTRPVVFFDIETTGVNIAKDRIVEIGVVKWFPMEGGRRETKTYRFNPGMPIPASATKIHGISDADVKDKPPFSQLAKGFLEYIKGCDIGGFNSNYYDVPLLYEEFRRSGVDWDYRNHNFIDACSIYKIKEERTLAAAYKFYTGKILENAHNAEVDINATVDVFEGQMAMYFSGPESMSMAELDEFCNYGKKRLDFAGMFVYGDDNKTILFSKGKYKGQSIKTDYTYLSWIHNGVNDFPADTKNMALHFMQNFNSL